MKINKITFTDSVNIKKVDLESPNLYKLGPLTLQVGPIGRAKFKGGLREAVIVEDTTWVWLTADFSSQEMCLMANFSRDSGLVTPLLEGKDIHMYIAKMMFGYEDPNHRTAIKIVNFASNYGAKGPTLARKLKCTVQKATELLEHYNRTLSKLTAWKESMMKEGRRKGMIFTYFSRPRLVYKYYQSSDRGLHGYADRTCVNHCVQGCVPLNSYIELDGRVVALKSILSQKVLQGIHEMVPTKRGNDPIFKVVFKSGDFIFCNYAHGFVHLKDAQPYVNRVSNVDLTVKNVLVPLQRKVLPSLKTVLRISASTCAAFLLLKVLNSDELISGDPSTSAMFFKLWLTRFEIKIEDREFIKVMRLRSLAHIYGFNLVNVKGTKYRVKWNRKEGSTIKSVTDTGINSDTCCCTALNGFQTYNCCGVVNKNTGGDIIRIVVTKFFKKYYEDSDFGRMLRENCKFLNTVHDEINLQVKLSHLKEIRDFVHEIMYFKPTNFIIPISEEAGISVPQLDLNTGKLKAATWGTCLDFSYIDDNNQIHLNEYEDEGVYVGLKL